MLLTTLTSDASAVRSDGLQDLHLEVIKLGSVVGLGGGGNEGDQGEGEAVDGFLQADQGLADGFPVGDHGHQAVHADDGGQERRERIHHQLRIRHREMRPRRIVLQHAGGIGDGYPNVLEPRGHLASLRQRIHQVDLAGCRIHNVRQLTDNPEQGLNVLSGRGVGRLAAQCQRQHHHEHSPCWHRRHVDGQQLLFDQICNEATPRWKELGSISHVMQQSSAADSRPSSSAV